MRVGIAHHLGWAVAVTATADHRVVDRRRIELLGPGVGAQAVEQDIAGLDDDGAAALVAGVRTSAARVSAASLDALSASLPEPIVSLSLRAWPLEFPEDIATLRRAPYNSQADSVMFRQVLAELAAERGWAVHLFDGGDVEKLAAHVLGSRADDVLYGPRQTLGPPWNKDHRMALAATVLAS